jgi:hypothetical protein
MGDHIEPDGDEVSYERLYRRWEKDHWSATEIDFSVDADHWQSQLDDAQRRAALWNYAMFLAGVTVEARTLSAVLDALPGADQRAFLSTQIVDEARHRVFLDRFLREVAGQGRDTATTAQAAGRHVTWGFSQILSELERVTDALRKKPSDRALLAQSVALCHVVIEGVLAIPGEHFIQRYVDNREILPGLAAGLAAVARDEARHISFGILFLSDLLRSSTECRAAAIQTWNRVLPWMVGVFVPPNLDRSYVECFDFTLEEIYAFGLRAFETRMRQVEVDPSELLLLSRDDRSLSYDDRARRLLALIRDGVLGDDRKEPKLSPESFEILFEGMARSIDIELARSLGGPIEWDFTDADSWHLVVTDGDVEAKPGKTGTAALRLECASGEWAKITVGRTDARWALLTRRLRVHGPWANKAKLSRLFH